MAKKVHIAVVFNEPTVATSTGRKFISEMGKIEAAVTRAQVISANQAQSVDLSEVGVLEERAQVQDALSKTGYKTSLFNMNSDIKRLIQFIEEKEPDLIFNLCESVGDEATHEMFVAGLYELMGVPYTGAGAFALGTCQNKARTKQILSFYDIKVPKFALYKNANEVVEDSFNLKFPVIVKPSLEDASVGIDNGSVVDNFPALKKRVRHIFQNFDQPALVDEYIEGRELNVAIIGNRRPIILPISEIDFSGLPAELPKIVTYAAKWLEGTDEYKGTVGVCPAQIPPEVEKQAKEIALQAYRVMGCRDYARVDMRLDKNNNLYVIEVNPNPDISDDAGFARSARAYGYSFDEIINKIVEYALERTP
ncbi:MAG: ATP-grasp domain-containing protein [Ignavibacteriales bacterium]|nr:ATP-grasp domain-containing protein [Ignavibacteriales bacterium]